MTRPARFFAEFLAYGRGRIVTAAGLLGATVVVEAAALAALVEVTRLVGLTVETGPLSSVAGTAARLLQAIGLAPTFTVVLAAYVVLAGIRGALERAQALWNQRLEAGFVADLRGRLYRALTFADWSFHAGRRVADAVHALTQEADRVGSAVYYLLQMIGGAALAAVYLGLALWASPLLTAVVLACGALLAAFVRKPARAAIDSGERTSETSESLYRAIAEHLTGIKTAKSHGAEGRHVAVFTRLSQDVADAGTRLVRVSSGVRQRLEIITVVLLAVLLFVSREELRLPAGDTLVLAFVFARLMPKLRDLLVQGTALLSLWPSFDRVIRLEEAGLAAAEDLAASGQPPVPLERDLRLESVSVVYPDRPEVPALSDVDLRVPSGQVVAVVGPSGAGKSTLADVVMGLLRPTRGRLLVDEVPTDGARMAGWRRSVGYVAQETFLLHDTIRANLLWAEPEATDDDLWTALGQAAAADFVRGLPARLDTIVGDRGVLLSGGERQRLALARALLRRPRLLILDEATSALDPEHEAIVLGAIAALRGRLAILLMTHRLSAVRDADRIVVLEAGRLVEAGSWPELVRSPSKFRAMCELQGVNLSAVERAGPRGAAK